jgi:hypothetical protein
LPSDEKNRGVLVPAELLRLHRHKDPAARERVMRAMMGMVKLDAAALKRAATGGA